MSLDISASARRLNFGFERCPNSFEGSLGSFESYEMFDDGEFVRLLDLEELVPTLLLSERVHLVRWMVYQPDSLIWMIDDWI